MTSPQPSLPNIMAKCSLVPVISDDNETFFQENLKKFMFCEHRSGLDFTAIMTTSQKM